MIPLASLRGTPSMEGEHPGFRPAMFIVLWLDKPPGWFWRWKHPDPADPAAHRVHGPFETSQLAYRNASSLSIKALRGVT